MTYKIKCPYCKKEIEYIIIDRDIEFGEECKGKLIVKEDGIHISEEYDCRELWGKTYEIFECPICGVSINLDKLIIEDDSRKEISVDDFTFEIHI